MVDRLTVEDASFLYLEDTTTPMHVGGVAIFRESEAGFDYDRLVKLIRDRIALAPRYRQKIKEVPGNMGAPVWVDDSNFDVTFHVRRSALPRPGTDAQLRELVARIMARPLDRNRPMWEMYLVEGLKGRRFAILTKSHHAIVDGIMTVDIGQVILDDAPIAELEGTQVWRPTREPSQVELLVGAAAEQLRSPAGALGSVKRGVHDVTSTVTGIGRSMLGLMSAAVSVARSPIHGPLNFELSEQRRFAMASLKLSDFKAIRTAHGGTVNDVVLAVIAGALRTWLQSRGERVSPRDEMTALVPVSVEPSFENTHPGDVQPFLVQLPIGEADPVVRLSRISYEMHRHRESSRLVGAETLATIAGFAPPTLHALGARVGADITQRVYNLAITNVPGPQTPLFVGGAEMVAAYPVVALTRGHGLSIGLTSYNGGMYFGLNADRDGIPDVEELADCLKASLFELKEASKGRRRPRRAPRQDVLKPDPLAD
ncbi:MAG: wax ester/triacylglycerol synthase family O-acyltransferase [Actinobacteria bacterium]|nr:MAG: wax ester/triacylglycerol synthase family O-acyltransferase [Actinomycetota bacterium]